MRPPTLEERMDLPAIDASDPKVKVTLNNVPFEVPLWQTDFDLADIVDLYVKSEKPGAWLAAIKEMLAKHGGPPADQISDGDAYTFYVNFRTVAAAQAELQKKRLSGTPS